jgi:hypothetical protein
MNDHACEDLIRTARADERAAMIAELAVALRCPVQSDLFEPSASWADLLTTVSALASARGFA